MPSDAALRRRLRRCWSRPARPRSICAGRWTRCSTCSRRCRPSSAPPPPMRGAAEICRRGRGDQPRHRRARPRDSSEAIAAKKPGEPVNILTHCNAGWLATVDWGTATAPIYAAHDAGIPIHVWVDETRPRNQGASLTAWELLQHGVPHTVIADNTGGHLMQHGMVDLVHRRHRPHHRAAATSATRSAPISRRWPRTTTACRSTWRCPSPTIDWTLVDGVREIPIEERGGHEVSHMTGPHRRTAASRRCEIVPRRLAGRQLRLRRDAGAARDRPHHRARRDRGEPRRRLPGPFRNGRLSSALDHPAGARARAASVTRRTMSG